MSSDPSATGRACAEVEGSLAELALGTLAGDERARVLDHLDHCPQCRAELQRQVATADALLQLAPGVEPPLGFESRLFARMGIAEPGPEVAPRAGRVARLSIRSRAWVAAAAATVAIGLGFGGGWLANPGVTATGPTQPSGAAATATLTSGTRQVGTVSTYGGSPGWLLMTMHDGVVNGPVICQVGLADGRQVTVGSFSLDYGYGAWAVRLPDSSSPIRSARVVEPDGTVVAQATLTT
jgi:Putative zinc-finger